MQQKTDESGGFTEQTTSRMIDIEDQAWMNTDLSGLSDLEPYDWGDVDPRSLGKPIRYEPGRGFVVEGGKS